jgi:hypothetical protein
MVETKKRPPTIYYTTSVLFLRKIVFYNLIRIHIYVSGTKLLGKDQYFYLLVVTLRVLIISCLLLT